MSKNENPKILLKIDSLFSKLFNFLKSNKTSLYIVKMIVLFIAMAIILSIIYLIFRTPIDSYEERIEKSYVREIYEYGGNSLKIISTEIENSDGLLSNGYRIIENGNFIGYALKELVKGKNNDMVFIIGFYNDTSLAGIRIMKHNETLRLTSLLENENYLNQFSSSHINSTNRTKIIKFNDLPRNTAEFKKVFGVNSIKNAEITSMAIIEAIRNAYRKIL